MQTWQKWLVGCGVAAVTGGALGTWAWFRTPSAPDPAKQTPQKLMEYMASDEFAAQPREVKEQYFQRMRQLREEGGREAFRGAQLDDPQRRQLRQNMRSMFEERMDETMQKYFALPADQRTAYLDQLIDEQQARMSRWREERSRRAEERAASGPAEGQQTAAGSGEEGDRPRRADRGRRGLTPERLKQRIEHTTPERRAMREEFMKALRKRMEERGIEMRGPGGGGPRR